MNAKATIISALAFLIPTVMIGYPITSRRKEKVVTKTGDGKDTHMAFAKAANGTVIYDRPDGNVITRLPRDTYIGAVASMASNGWQQLMVGVDEDGRESAYQVWALSEELHIPEGLAKGRKYDRTQAKDKTRKALDLISKKASKYG